MYTLSDGDYLILGKLSPVLSPFIFGHDNIFFCQWSGERQMKAICHRKLIQLE
jgi:hypothetical protein